MCHEIGDDKDGAAVDNTLAPQMQARYLDIQKSIADYRTATQKAAHHPLDSFLGGFFYRLPILIWMAWMAHNLGIFLAGGNTTPVGWYLVAFLISVLFTKLGWEARIHPALTARRCEAHREEKEHLTNLLSQWWSDVRPFLTDAGYTGMELPEIEDPLHTPDRIYGYGDTLWSVSAFVHNDTVWMIDHTGRPVGTAPQRADRTPKNLRKGRNR